MTIWSGAVLTGGASRRMGRDKATLEIGGRAMSARVAHALEQAGAAEVLFVGGGPSDRSRRAIPDDHPGEGPLGGLVTALRAAANELVVVLACDLIEPSPTAIRRLVDEAEVEVGVDQRAATIPVVARAPQWLHGAWLRGICLGPLTEAFAEGERSVHRAATCLDIRFFDDSGAGFTDADAPEDLPDDR